MWVKVTEKYWKRFSRVEGSGIVIRKKKYCGIYVEGVKKRFRDVEIGEMEVEVVIKKFFLGDGIGLDDDFIEVTAISGDYYVKNNENSELEWSGSDPTVNIFCT